MLGNFVFDLDGAIAIIAEYDREKVEENIKIKYGTEYFSKHCITALNHPHYIFPGYYALFRWLHSKGGKIFFFSSGVEERNIELVDKLMKMSFGDSISDIEYKIFSRQHCIDTANMDSEIGDKYQSFFWGQRKKKLADIVVPENELQNTLLIDDDNSYMVKGEELNFVYLRYTYTYLHDDKIINQEAYVYFLRAYYLAGLFSKIFEVKAEQNITLTEAAKYVQIDLTGKELSKDFYYPSVYIPEYYCKGYEILKQIDNTLELYYEIPKIMNRIF